ncbi:acyl-ACP--UDP-N-acetylglucosamine O-acyltransferase [Alphaproteobacteria bacterium]|nr:acyl-ACP--UDP-N-acetylglucosamine O-acyltransferase [Alphaproteobacteria bacterium]
MSQMIHPTAVIDKGATLAADVQVGPFCVIGPHVVLEEGVKLHSHVVIEGRTHVGAETEIFPFSSIGHRPQDLKFGGEPSTVQIGKKCMIREYVTIQPGTKGGAMKTVVGNGCLIMASAHVAHDCIVGDHVIMANNATLAGHVTVGDNAIIGGLSAIHQFVRIGDHAIIGGMSGVEKDVIPYGSVKGDRAYLAGLNIIGLKRRGFERREIDRLRAAYRQLFTTDGEEATFADRLQQTARQYKTDAHVEEVLTFITKGENRPLCLPKVSE